MLINVPDELVNRLVTSTDVRVELAEARKPLLRGAIVASGQDPDASYEARLGDLLAIDARRSKAVSDNTAAVQELKNFVYTTATGKAVPEAQ